MEFIDTHTHFYDEAYSSEENSVIERALQAGVSKMFQADVDSKERDRMFALTDKYPGVLYPMLGLYPGSVDKDWQKEMDILISYKDRKPIAIGEIGLDYHYNSDFVREQKDALKVQLELSIEMGLPVNIHLRDATNDFFDVLESCRHLALRGNLHAFSGSYETFKRMEKYGDWYVGIGGVVTFKKAALAEAVKLIPLERIVLETDGPYLTPTPYRGTRNESAYIPIIAQKIADLKGISLEEVARITTENAQKLFNLI